jgi:hypothetical protein
MQRRGSSRHPMRPASRVERDTTATDDLATVTLKVIHPLAVEVDQRWKALFPGRGDLNTASDGNITRTVNGHPLPYDSFSTGESMGATILLRLLVAQMATDADFCWFDEPLEHLDPDVRRKVASLLSRVTGGEGPLRQVVVTTYQEPLAPPEGPGPVVLEQRFETLCSREVFEAQRSLAAVLAPQHPVGVSTTIFLGVDACHNP